MIQRAQLKQEAKGILREARVSPYLFTLLCLAITLVMNAIDEYTSLPATVERLLSVDPRLAAELPPFLLNVSFPRLPAMFIDILVLLLTITLGAGVSLYHLGIRRREEMPYATLFDGFGMVGKVVAVGLLRAILIYLWSFLFIVPGIIAAYRYRFAMYNQLENPELSPIDALRMSRVQTSGFKGELFLLDLSFLGWMLLSVLTLGILSIWVSPYYQQTDVGYFRAIKSIKGIGLLPDGGDAPGRDPTGPEF